MAKETSFWWSTICRKTTETTGTRVPTPRKMTRKMICRESALLELGVHISVDRALPARRARSGCAGPLKFNPLQFATNSRILTCIGRRPRPRSRSGRAHHHSRLSERFPISYILLLFKSTIVMCLFRPIPYYAKLSRSHSRCISTATRLKQQSMVRESTDDFNQRERQDPCRQLSR
jgi:hypothetical protein